MMATAVLAGTLDLSAPNRAWVGAGLHRYVADLLGDGLWRPASRSVYAMGRDGVLPRPLGVLDARNEPLWALAAVGVLVTPPAADAPAAVRIFWDRREAAWSGVAAPFVGRLTLGGVMAATILLEERFLAYIALIGVCLGIPFALWRGAAVGKAAGEPPGYCEPTALAPPL